MTGPTGATGVTGPTGLAQIQDVFSGYADASGQTIAPNSNIIFTDIQFTSPIFNFSAPSGLIRVNSTGTFLVNFSLIGRSSNTTPGTGLLYGVSVNNSGVLDPKFGVRTLNTDADANKQLYGSLVINISTPGTTISIKNAGTVSDFLEGGFESAALATATIYIQRLR